MGRSCVRTHPIRQNSTVRPRRALGGKEDSPGWRDAASRGGAEGSVEWTWREPTQRGRTPPLRRRSRRATHTLPALSGGCARAEEGARQRVEGARVKEHAQSFEVNIYMYLLFLYAGRDTHTHTNRAAVGE